MLKPLQAPSLDQSDALRIENATLRAEVRRRLPLVPRRKRLVDQAFADAKLLIDWRYGGMSITQRGAYNMGMGRRRWSRAVTVLHRAGIWNRVDVVVDEYEECLRLLGNLQRRAANTGAYRWLFG